MMTRKLVVVVVVVVARLGVRSSGGVPVVQSQNLSNFRYLSSCGAGLAAHRAGCMASNLGPEVGSWSLALFSASLGQR